MTTLYEFAALFTENGSGVAPSSAPTITVVDSANNILVALSTATTALTNLVGAYRYSYSGADGLTCYAKFTTTDLTVDQYEIGCVAVINPIVRDIQTRLPAALTANGYMKSSILEGQVTISGSLSSPQNFNLIGNIQGSIGNVTGSVGGMIGLVPSNLDVPVSSRQPSGTVFVQDKTGFSLSNPQIFDLIGNISGSIYGNIYGSINSIISGSFITQVFVYSPPIGGNPPPSTIGNIYAYRGDTFIIPVLGLGSLANLSKLYFTVKNNIDDSDTESIIQIELGTGLIYINGVISSTPVNGSIVITDAVLGNIIITLSAKEMAKLDLISGLDYDIEIVRTSGTPVTTLQSGKFNVVGDVTKATS